MADNLRDVITTVTTVDIQLLDSNREDTTLVKLDNPKESITREQVSAVMQPALAGGWFLTNQDRVAMYLGDVTVSQSIKRKLDGADFYVTPTEVNERIISSGMQMTIRINVSGATIQGYNFVDYDSSKFDSQPVSSIENNGLQFKTVTTPNAANTFKIELVIQGVVVTIPVTITASE